MAAASTSCWAVACRGRSPLRLFLADRVSLRYLPSPSALKAAASTQDHQAVPLWGLGFRVWGEVSAEHRDAFLHAQLS